MNRSLFVSASDRWETLAAPVEFDPIIIFGVEWDVVEGMLQQDDKGMMNFDGFLNYDLTWGT